MFQEFSSWLYQLLHGIQEWQEFEDQIYQQSATALIVWTLVSVTSYYYVIGWLTSEFNMLRHWFLTLAANCFLTALTVVVVGRFVFETWRVPPPIVTLAMIQVLYAGILFTLLSFAIQWGSPNARRTPL